MSYDLQGSVYAMINWVINFYDSPFIFVVKILAGIYLAVLFANIILLLILRDIPQHIRVGMRGMDIPTATKNRMKKRWEKVTNLLDSDNVSQYKLAIIEADAIVDEILSGIGYKGDNMTEKFEQVGKAHLDDHLEALKGVHEIRNRIVHEADFEVDRRMAKTVVGVYENFLKYLEYLD